MPDYRRMLQAMADREGDPSNERANLVRMLAINDLLDAMDESQDVVRAYFKTSDGWKVLGLDVDIFLREVLFEVVRRSGQEALAISLEASLKLAE